MKGINGWAYSPYRPFLTCVGDVYICRVVPDKNKIRFEWLDAGEETYSVFYKKRDSESFILYCKTEKSFCDIEMLDTENFLITTFPNLCTIKLICERGIKDFVK